MWQSLLRPILSEHLSLPGNTCMCMSKDWSHVVNVDSRPRCLSKFGLVFLTLCAGLEFQATILLLLSPVIPGWPSCHSSHQSLSLFFYWGDHHPAAPKMQSFSTKSSVLHVCRLLKNNVILNTVITWPATCMVNVLLNLRQFRVAICPILDLWGIYWSVLDHVCWNWNSY